MIKFRWSAYHKRLVAYTLGTVCLVETSYQFGGLRSAEYVAKIITDDRRTPYIYIPYNG